MRGTAMLIVGIVAAWTMAVSAPRETRSPSTKTTAATSQSVVAGTSSPGALLDAASSQLNLQFFLADDDGDPLQFPGNVVDLTIRIYDVGSGTFDEVDLVDVPMADGVVSVQVPLAPPEIDPAALFDGSAKEIGVLVTGELTELGRFPLVSVPYAFRVHRVASEELDDDIAVGLSANVKGKISFHSGTGTPPAMIEGIESGVRIREYSTTAGGDPPADLEVSGELRTEDAARLGNGPDDKTTTEGELEVKGRLTAKGAVDVDGVLTAKATATVKGVLNTEETTNLGNGAGDKVTAADELEVKGRLMAKGAVDVDGTLTAKATATVEGVLNTEETTNLGNGAGDKVTAADELEVKGILSAKGAVDVDGTLTAKATATVQGDLNTQGTTNLGNDDLDGATVRGDLVVRNSFDAQLVRVEVPAVQTGPTLLAMRFDSEDVVVLETDAELSYQPRNENPVHHGPRFTLRGLGVNPVTLNLEVHDIVEIGCTNMDDFEAGHIIIKNDQIHPDIAEEFEVPSADDPAPGTVMVIDPSRRGGLMQSTQAYDPKVVGIVSGAGDSRPAFMVEYRHGSANTAKVALAGRVNCLVDTTYGEIRAGDMIVTSPTPGYGMAATDKSRASGAVLGKAMESMEAGQKGLVLVLVTLQ